MVNKRIIMMMEMHVSNRVKGVIANITYQGIIASAKHSLKQVIKHQRILW